MVGCGRRRGLHGEHSPLVSDMVRLAIEIGIDAVLFLNNVYHRVPKGMFATLFNTLRLFLEAGGSSRWRVMRNYNVGGLKPRPRWLGPAAKGEVAKRLQAIFLILTAWL